MIFEEGADVANAKKTVLIVDDEPELREYLSWIVSPLDVDVFQSDNGVAALKTLQGHGIDLILSDLRMPELDGLELLTEMRNLAKEAPFILITAFSDKETLQTAFRLGPLDFIEKPFNIKAVRATVEKALEISTRQKALEQEYAKMIDERAAAAGVMERIRTNVLQRFFDSQICASLEIENLSLTWLIGMYSNKIKVKAPEFFRR